MIKKILILCTVVFIVLSMVACDEKDVDDSEDDDMVHFVMPVNPGFGSSVTAHDPAILKAEDGMYYTFGSHFTVTQSTNLIHWLQVARDNQTQVLYNRNWRDVLSDGIAHVGNPGSTWAPMVIYIDGLYYMYYSLSTFGSSRSYIGRVQSKNPLGPYDNSVEVLKSFGTGGPNAIDAQLFFDEEGRLWMTYGSFFAGIYIIELHNEGPQIGLPIESGIGKKLWNGGNQGPEGPHIFYNPDTNYYYLMVSAGSLFTNYNMRVARSENPNGPYVDMQGLSVENFSTGGTKLAGNFHFQGYPTGYAAMGHNSVHVENGLYYNTFHSRYREGNTNNVTGMHNQFTHQLYFNIDGWPVMAPNRYAGERLAKVTMSQASGIYDLLIHSGGNSEAFQTSTRVDFKENGKIVENSNVLGTWTITEDYYVEIKIGLNTYKGVVVPQWNHVMNYSALSFTAISRNGLSLWANGI